MRHVLVGVLRISTLDRVIALIQDGDVRVSEHGWDELEVDDISVRDVIAGVAGGAAIEDYPEFGKGPSVLVLLHDRDERPIHVVWGIPKGIMPRLF